VRSETLQFAVGISQPISDVPLVSAISDLSFEAVDLIDERLSSDSDGPVTIRIHDDRLYRASSFVYVYGWPYE
jgi:hypothetical protein